MFFNKKGTKKDIKEIKEAVESKPEPLPLYPSDIEFKKIEAKLPEKPNFAPLFIKLDRYKEVLDLIESLKMNLKDLHNIVSVKKEIDEIKKRADSILEGNISVLSNIIKSIDSELVKPSAINRPGIIASTHVEKEEMNSSISQLQEELNALRHKLQKM